jgi:hypothetical protein
MWMWNRLLHDACPLEQPTKPEDLQALELARQGNDQK